MSQQEQIIFILVVEEVTGEAGQSIFQAFYQVIVDWKGDSTTNITNLFVLDNLGATTKMIDRCDLGGLDAVETR